MIDFPERSELYPLLFKPLYKSVMWGGKSLAETFDRELPPENLIGESAEIVDRPEMNSIVENGSLAGASLAELTIHYRSDLLGRGDNSRQFPLLVKLIDAEKRLSLQVHPDAAACEKLGGNAEPKTEMWVVLKARPGAEILAGVARNSAQHLFVDALQNNGNLEDCVEHYPSVPGDAYFIRAGRIHAIGDGNIIYEVQQNSDTTYRVSDWGRLDENGQPRQLHVEEALKCIDFTDRNSPRIPGASNITAHNRKIQLVANCPFFTVDALKLVRGWNDNTLQESFHILMPIDGDMTIGNERFKTLVKRGRSCLIPACFGAYTVELSTPVTVIRTTR